MTPLQKKALACCAAENGIRMEYALEWLNTTPVEYDKIIESCMKYKGWSGLVKAMIGNQNASNPYWVEVVVQS